MKVAITADVHLRSRAESPARYRALESVFQQSRAAGAGHVVVAGDLLDAEYRSFGDFEGLCRPFGDLEVHVIPGNHDAGLSERSMAGAHVHVYSEARAVDLGGTCFLFLPYAPGTTMAQALAEAGGRPPADPWVLVGHGDYYGGVREPNPLEPGTYMPLTRTEVEGLGARAVFLGHIHKPGQWGSVWYAGSPCGLDIHETGVRRFLLYDTATGRIEARPVVTDHLYFIESFVVLPVADEVALLEGEIARRIAAWGIGPADQGKVRVRVAARGYATDRRAIQEALERGFRGYRFDDEGGPDTAGLSMASDDQRNAIAQRTRAVLEGLDWDFGGDEPDREEVLMAALAAVYGS
ncbi:MAG: metallophosphoesterase [Gemmatimonadota bacterium]